MEGMLQAASNDPKIIKDEERTLRETGSDNPEDGHPFVNMAGDIPACFFVLHVGGNISSFTNEREAILLRGLLIDRKYQGKGLRRRLCGSLRNLQKRDFRTRNHLFK